MSDIKKFDIKKIVIFGYGNPSRGDDAIAPFLIEKLIDKYQDNPNITIITDFQLQVEYALDLMDKDLAIFIDASITCKAPCEYYKIHPEKDNSHSTHALSPQAILYTYENIQKNTAPEAYILAVRGYSFELGEKISEKAMENSYQAWNFLIEKICLSLY